MQEQAGEDLTHGSAFFDGEPRPVQLRDMSLRSGEDGAGRCSGSLGLAEQNLELAGASCESRIDQAVESERRCVGYHGHDVVELYGDLPASKQCELAKLLAGGQAISAKQGNKRRACLRRDLQIRLPHLLVDDTRKLFSVSA